MKIIIPNGGIRVNKKDYSFIKNIKFYLIRVFENFQAICKYFNETHITY